jgi:hypothetical protein
MQLSLQLPYHGLANVIMVSGINATVHDSLSLFTEFITTICLVKHFFLAKQVLRFTTDDTVQKETGCNPVQKQDITTCRDC